MLAQSSSQKMTFLPVSLPRCLRPTLMAANGMDAASRIPDDELPIMKLACVYRDKNHSRSRFLKNQQSGSVAYQIITSRMRVVPGSVFGALQATGIPLSLSANRILD